MKIILADPPDIKTPWLLANHPNLGILYLAGYLRQRIEDVQVYYLEAHLNLKEHLQKVEEVQPDLYGISFSSMRTYEAYQTISHLKKELPSLPIICGGAHPTIAPAEVLIKTPADVCVIGEGEEALSQVVEAVCLGKRNLEEVTGIAFRKNGEIVFNPKRSLVKDLDKIPLPAWDLVDFRRYIGNYQYRQKPSTVMVTSRGCPFNCVFCSNPVWRNNKPWLRLRSPQNIAQEVALLYQRGIREISIRSDEFNAKLDWGIDVCKEIQKLNFKDLFFQTNLRADQYSEELIREMAKSNFWLVQLGIESGNQRVLDGIGKKVTLGQIEDICQLLKKYNIKIFGYIMIYNIWEENGNLCYETPAEVENTFSFIKKLKSKKLLSYMSFSVATPIRGSQMYEIAKRHRILKDDKEAKDVTAFHISLPGVTDRQMKRSRLKGMLLQLFLVLKSGRYAWADRRKEFHKLKYLLRSIR